MQTSSANGCEQRVHWDDPDQQPYTADEFEQYAHAQGMTRNFALQMWHEATRCPPFMSYHRRKLPGNQPAPKCRMEQAILSQDVREIRILIVIYPTITTKLLDGLEPPISPITFSVCMQAWGAFECLFTHGALFGPRAMQALTAKQSVPTRYLALCTRAYNGYANNGYVQAHHRMAKRVLKPITCRLTPAQALQIVESICASEGHENNIFF